MVPLYARPYVGSQADAFKATGCVISDLSEVIEPPSPVESLLLCLSRRPRFCEVCPVNGTHSATGSGDDDLFIDLESSKEPCDDVLINENVEASTSSGIGSGGCNRLLVDEIKWVSGRTTESF